MVKIEDSLKKKIWISIVAGILIVGLIYFGIFIAIKEKNIKAILIPVLPSIVILLELLMHLRNYFMYDDEKLVFSRLYEVNTVYFKDVEFFGIKESAPLFLAGKCAAEIRNII